MKKKLFLLFSSLVALVIVMSLFFSAPADVLKTSSQQNAYSFVLDLSNFGFLPTSSGTGQSTESNSPKTNNGNPITISYSNAYRSGTRIRLVKNSGYISNVTPFTGLKAVTVQIPSGTCSLYYGSSYGNYTGSIQVNSGVRYEINSLSFFKVLAGSSTPYINSITVEYLCDGTGELDPVTPHIHHGYHYLAKEPELLKAGNKEFYACSECQYVSLEKDDGLYVDAVLTYELPKDHIAYIAPQMLKQPSQFDHPIAINLQVPSTSYQADQTGTSDASNIIQSALNYVSSLGGGTLYVASGKYLLNNQIVIPNRVTLVGEFNGPNSSDYGTVFLCNKTHNGTSSIYNNAQIIVSSNAGINGITFYYPNQNVNSVVRYGHTIYAYNNMAATISNLLFINSYDGISVNDASEGAGELVNIENIYGTFLHSGITGYYQSDVGFWNNINISPSYYENALAEFRCSDQTALYKYTRENSIAMTLGDLDDFSLNKIYIDNAKIGIYFPTESNRPQQAFWGILNDVHLTNCLTGVYATRLFSGGGAVFTHSILGQIINVSNSGIIKLSKCSYDEILGHGETKIEYGSEDYEVAPTYDDSNDYNINYDIHYIDDLDTTGATDVSTQLQARLDECTGGGVIVLKNGTYRLDNPITVPSNSMLTSFANSFSRSLCNESSNELVKFLSYNSQNCVKLSSFAGINGIRIYNVYKDPDVAYNTLSVGSTDSFVAVKGIGNNSFAINSEVTYSYFGFDFTNVNNHYIKYCYGCAYDTFIKASGSGKILSSITNLNFLSRSSISLYAHANNETLEKYCDFEDSSKAALNDKVRDITRTYTTMIKLSGGDEFALHCFSYGIKTLIDTTNTQLLSINSSQDNLKDTSYSYIVNGGSVKIVNTLRVFGIAFNRISGHLEVYGRLDFNTTREAYYNSDNSTSDELEPSLSGLVEDVLNYCESTSGISGASRTSVRKYQGSYSLRASSKNSPAISYAFSNKDISSYMTTGYIRLYLYCSNIANKGEYAFVELTSGGTCDVDEITYHFENQIKVTGWNEILIKLSDLFAGPGTFNPSSLNYFRFYALNCNCDYYLDYISFFYKAESGSSILITDCESLDNSGAVSLSDFRMNGEHSYISNEYVNTTFVYFMPTTDIRTYMNGGFLSFYFYVSDIDKLGSVVQVELTSSGIWDNQEITCSVKEYINTEGWNQVFIPLNSFYKGSSNDFVPASCNFFRLYTLDSNSYFYLDDVRLIK